MIATRMMRPFLRKFPCASSENSELSEDSIDRMAVLAAGQDICVIFTNKYKYRITDV